jgi:chromosome segregation ATPase
MIDRAFIQAEYEEARAQRDAAQAQFNHAQATIQAAQQSAANARDAGLIAEGMMQQAKALLDKLPKEPALNSDTSDTEPPG